MKKIYDNRIENGNDKGVRAFEPLIRVVMRAFGGKQFVCPFSCGRNTRCRENSLFLTEQHVRDKHDAESDKQSIGRASLASVRVGFGDHFVADDVEHHTAGKGKRKG